MIVENESNWRTDDLKALVEGVTGMEGFRQGSHVTDNTLLLFTTSRRKATKSHHSSRRTIEPDAVEYERYPTRYHDSVLVKIRAGKRLGMDALHRMAHIGDTYEQDMKAADVQLVATCIGKALGCWRTNENDYSWARHKSLRLKTRSTGRSKTGIKRLIAKLEDRIYAVRRESRRKEEKIEEQISKLRSKL